MAFPTKMRLQQDAEEKKKPAMFNLDPRDFVKKLEEAKAEAKTEAKTETKVWKWSTSTQEGATLAGGGRGSNPGKLLISNLHPDVTEGVLINLFGQEGQLQSASLHYGRQGKSLGTAVVIFNRSSDAKKGKRQEDWSGLLIIITLQLLRIGTERSSTASP